MKKLVAWIPRNIALIAICCAAVAIWKPEVSALVPASAIAPLLALIMFAMGLSLRSSDFAPVFTRPKSIAVGIAAQFAIMPTVAYALAKAFALPPELALGVILVGCCPGGTASNVITYLAKGDLALSVAVTACSTLLAPFLTPLLTLALAGESIEVPAGAMFVSIVQIVLVPVTAGFLINHFFGRYVDLARDFLPALATVAIVVIITAVVGANASKIMTSGALVAIVVALHNLAGYALGWAGAKIAGLGGAQAKAVSIEVGMQNSGLATSLAATQFAAMPAAALAGAIFSVWHNISGAVLANYFAKRD